MVSCGGGVRRWWLVTDVDVRGSDVGRRRGG